jgi:hypothetical protein
MSDVKSYVVVDGQTLDTAQYSFPQNRYFNDAWTLAEDENHNQIVVIDVEKAKEVWKRRMRETRAPLMTKLDADYFKALETQNTAEASSIAATKQLLRDVTKLPELLNATTVEEIEAVWPDYLKG